MNKAFLFFAMILLLCVSNAHAQDDDEKQEEVKAVPNTKLVWRILDIAGTNANAPLTCMNDAKGNKTDLNSFLSRAIKAHEVTAYNISENFKNIDTLSAMWHYNYKPGKAVQGSGFDKLDNADDPSLFTSRKYFIQEYWVFVKELNRMVCTIEWIGPCGTDEQGEVRPLFGVKFEDISPLLGKYTFCNNKEESKDACIDFFESRTFASEIIKTTGMYIAAPKDKEKEKEKEDDDDK